MPILIGDRYCELRKPTLRRHEAAFVLRASENEVRNMLRRGERLRAQGLTDEEVVASGALPPCLAGRARAVRPTILALHPRVKDSLLALEMLRALTSGRAQAPRAVASTELPPDLTERLHRL